MSFTWNRQMYYVFVFFSRFDRIVHMLYLLMPDVCLPTWKEKQPISFSVTGTTLQTTSNKLKSILFYLYCLMRLNWQFVICACWYYNRCVRKCYIMHLDITFWLSVLCRKVVCGEWRMCFLLAGTLILWWSHRLFVINCYIVICCSETLVMSLLRFNGKSTKTQRRDFHRKKE